MIPRGIVRLFFVYEKIFSECSYVEQSDIVI